MAAEEHVNETIAPYALDLLDVEETQQVAQHLSRCPACQAALRDYQEVMLHLAYTAPQADPPEALKGRLLSQVGGTGPAAKPAAGDAAAKRPSNPQPSAWERLVRNLGLASPAWGVGSLVLVLVLIASNLLLLRQNAGVTGVPVENTGMQVVSLEQSSVGAKGLMVISADGAHGTLVVDRMDALPPEQQYQVWLVKGEQRTSGGVFSVDDEGYGVLWIDAPQPLVSYDRVGITVEPAGGSPGPTGERVLGGDL